VRLENYPGRRNFAALGNFEQTSAARQAILTAHRSGTARCANSYSQILVVSLWKKTVDFATVRVCKRAVFLCKRTLLIWYYRCTYCLIIMEIEL